MYVEHLSLTDFRCYASAEVALAPGVTVFVGQNGQGKTNLVEAVEFLSTLSSHRVSSDAPLVRAGAEQAIARARVRAGRDDARTLTLELEINPGKSNRARINRTPQPRVRDLVGVLRTVLFSPEDLAILKGDPSDRRKFIDTVVQTRWPRMAGVKSDYDRVLRQRNALLKQAAGKHGGGRPDDQDSLEFTLEVFDEQLSQFGAELLLARLDTLAELLPHATGAYAEIAPTNNTISAHYTATFDISDTEEGASPSREELAARMRGALRDRRRDELARGVSLIGPHRDEIQLGIGDLPAKGYASHGESWSLALALRLGSFELVRSDGTQPVLILDDVFAELDATRRERLAEAILPAEQVLITAAVAGDVPARLAGRRFRVADRQVTLDPELSTDPDGQLWTSDVQSEDEPHTAEQPPVDDQTEAPA